MILRRLNLIFLEFIRMERSKKIYPAFFLIFSLFANIAFCGEIDGLLDKLVEKNILQGWEAQEIRINTQEEVKKEISEGSHKTLPLWVQSLYLGGDIRLRYQESKNDKSNYERQRGRYRVRFFASTKVNEQVLAGFGFASGENSDPRSTNQTFKDNFGKKGLYIDYVYAEYYPYSWLSLSGGRNKNPLWLSNDMIWDSDINPEGANFKTEAAISSLLKIQSIGGFFLLNESSSAPNDPYARYFQQFFYLRNSDSTLHLKGAFTYYDFKYITGKTVLNYRPSVTEGYLNSNTLKSGKYKYFYKPVSADAEISYFISEPIGIPFTDRNISNIAVFGNYLKNTAISKGSKGRIYGFRFGQDRVDDAGQFQFSFSQRRLEKDSWLDTYPDSDFYGGSTGVKGREYILTIGLLRNFSVILDYYETYEIGSSKKEKLFQSDINFKF